MKATIKFLAPCLLPLFFSCEKPKEVDDGRPRIKAISIAGIPQKDIEFIPERYVINVKLPADSPKGGLVPSFKLTENTEFIEGLRPNGTFPFTCGHYVLKVANDKKTAIYRNTTSYQINFKSAPGCPEPNGTPTITYVRDSSNAHFMSIFLPVKNSNSQSSVTSITLRNISTGAKYSNAALPWAPSLGGTNCSVPNTMRVFYSPYWSNPKMPSGSGSYEVSINMTCGEENRIITFPQPLFFTE